MFFQVNERRWFLESIQNYALKGEGRVQRTAGESEKSCFREGSEVMYICYKIRSSDIGIVIPITTISPTK